MSYSRREKSQDMSVLEDKSGIENFRELYNRYGSEDVESIYDKVIEYDDEYDDTYDSHLIGANDRDSADELAAKKSVMRLLKRLDLCLEFPEFH